MADKALVEELKFGLDAEAMTKFCENGKLNRWSKEDSEEKLAKRIYNSGKFTLDRFTVESLKSIITELYQGKLEGARNKETLIERILDLRSEKPANHAHTHETNGHSIRSKTYGQNKRTPSPSRGQKRKTTQPEPETETEEPKKTSSPSRGQKRKTTETELTPSDHQHRELNVFTDEHLKEICSQKNLKTGGTKNQLIDRLIEDGMPLSEFDTEELQTIISKLYKERPVSEEEKELANQIRNLRKNKSTSPSKKRQESCEDEEGQDITVDRIKGFGEQVLREAMKHEWNVKLSPGADVYKLAFKKFQNGDFTWKYFSQCVTKYL